MLMPEDTSTDRGGTSTAKLAVRDLAVRGWTLLPNCVSARLRGQIQKGGTRMDYRQVRRLYDGLPHRIATGVFGQTVFSSYWEPSVQWTRSRTDVLESGTPPDFQFGIDILAPLGPDPIELDLVECSGRMPAEEFPENHRTRAVPVAPGALLMLDCRLFRRLAAEPKGNSVGFTIVRNWIAPAAGWPLEELKAMPSRAAAFFGRDNLPVSDIPTWLKLTHPEAT